MLWVIVQIIYSTNFNTLAPAMYLMWQSQCAGRAGEGRRYFTAGSKGNRVCFPSIEPCCVPPRPLELCACSLWQVAAGAANCILAQHVQNTSCRMSCLSGSLFGALPSEATATDVCRKGEGLHFMRFSSTFSQDHMVYIDVLYTSYRADD